MKIKILQDCHSSGADSFQYKAGDVDSKAPDSRAKTLISHGYAEEVKEPKAEKNTDK